MLIKWIKCEVPKENKDAFSKAQKEWRIVKNEDGFLGQVGGWSISNPLEACIISVWKDRDSYDEFMKNVHDKIFLENQQGKTYSTISVSIFDKIEIGDVEDLKSFLKKGSVLRGIHYRRNIFSQREFKNLYKEWMSNECRHLLGDITGVFLREVNNGKEYFILSIWKDNLLDNNQNNLSRILFENEMFADSLLYLVELNDDWKIY